MRSDIYVTGGYLTDQNGIVINPCSPKAIEYIELDSSLNQKEDIIKRENGYIGARRVVSVLMKGYIAYCTKEEKLSKPIPFQCVKTFSILTPPNASLHFSVSQFCCEAIVNAYPYSSPVVDLLITIRTRVYPLFKQSELEPTTPYFILDDGCVCEKSIDEPYSFENKIYLTCKEKVLNTDVYQYNTIADGTKRIYTNDDKLQQYNSVDVLSPGVVSYYNLFANGVLQPRVNYNIANGYLEFLTDTVPAKGQSIDIAYVIIKDKTNEKMQAQNYYYCTMFQGSKRIYTNADAMRPYSNYGIPNEDNVSLVNLFVNGVLQPTINFAIKDHILELKMVDLPIDGSIITLEIIIIRGKQGELLKVDAPQFNAYADGKIIYTNQDRIKMYKSKPIISPSQCSFQTVYVNGVIQPEVNYKISPNYLCFETDDAPLLQEPITIQSVKVITMVDD